MKKSFFILVFFVIAMNVTAQTYVAVTIDWPSIPPAPIVTQNGNVLTSSSLTGNQWYELTAGIIPGETGQTYTITANGNYFVIVSDETCWSDTSNIITVAVGLTEFVDEHSSISIYPNPSHGIVNVSFNNLKNIDIPLNVYNSLGNVVLAKQFQLSSGCITEEVKMDNLPNGIYLFRFEVGKDPKSFTIIKN